MATLVYAVDQQSLPPLEMPDRFRREIAYFMSASGTEGVGDLHEGEYWVRIEDARTWIRDGVFQVVSPLDSEHPATVELTEEQETWLEWMVANEIERVRLV